MRFTILECIRWFLIFAILICISLSFIFVGFVKFNLEDKKVIKITSPTSELHLDEYVNYNYVNAMFILVVITVPFAGIFVVVDVLHDNAKTKSNQNLPSCNVMNTSLTNIQPPPYSPPEYTPSEVTQGTPSEVTQGTPSEVHQETSIDVQFEIIVSI
jgi:hypothetical protein